MQECVFCKIVKREIPSYKIYEDSDIVAFLDIAPATPGHTLVVPKNHFKDIFDVDEETLKKINIVIKKIASQMKSALGVEGINVIQNNGKLAGQLVEHIHFHIIPRYAGDGLRIHFPRFESSSGDFEEMVKKLKTEANSSGSSYTPPWRGY